MSTARQTAVRLRPLGREHLTRTLEWANDPALARLLNRSRAIDPQEHDGWFASLETRRDTVVFAIELMSDERHVGNVWLVDIDARHRKAEIRIVIGDPAGLGVGSAAIDLAVRHAFDVLRLQRVYAYVLEFNPRARRAFEKAGFEVEGVLHRDRWSRDRFVDVFVLARLA